MKIAVPADITHSVEEVENFLVKHTGTKFDENNKCWIVDFNSFNDETDSLLFEWNQLRDMTDNCTYAECESNFELKLVETSDQIIPSDAGVSRGPIDAIEVASGNVEAFGNWRNARRNDMARGDSSDSD